MEITRNTFDNIVRLCRGYDIYTEYIDNYTQQVDAERRNRLRDESFNDIMQDEVGWKGYNRGIPAELKGKGNNTEQAVEDWLWMDGDRGITVMHEAHVPGGCYWMPGTEDAEDAILDECLYPDGEEIPFM